MSLVNLIYLLILLIFQSSLAREQAYVKGRAAGVLFWPNVSISLMQFGLRGKLTVEAAATNEFFYLIYLTVLLISQSNLA